VGSFSIEAGEYLVISVGDTGCGITPADLGRIFDPFFTTKEVGKGTGLGLASVYGTMVSHKGAVNVASELARGTTFSLYFPCAAAHIPEASRAEGMPTGSGPVLVIDDEDMVRTAMAMQLEELGYTPVPVGDAVAAEATFRQRHPELVAVLLDLVMPMVSGADVAVRLRAIDPRVPIILISGFPRNAEIKQLIDQGVAGFLQKPFRQAELAQVLASLRRGGA
jgi:CheY-like chemotaxis protein